jgi:hypothetical protein
MMKDGSILAALDAIEQEGHGLVHVGLTGSIVCI